MRLVKFGNSFFVQFFIASVNPAPPSKRLSELKYLVKYGKYGMNYYEIKNSGPPSKSQKWPKNCYETAKKVLTNCNIYEKPPFSLAFHWRPFQEKKAPPGGPSACALCRYPFMKSGKKSLYIYIFSLNMWFTEFSIFCHDFISFIYSLLNKK